MDRIDVVVHPQSVVHSMVEFVDGSTIAQASPPDMRLPIALGLSWPHRLDDVGEPCRLDHGQQWTFEPLDEEAFPAVGLATARRRRLAAAPGGVQRGQRGVRGGVRARAIAVPRDRADGAGRC